MGKKLTASAKKKVQRKIEPKVKKNDKGKPDLSLIPYSGITEAARAFMDGSSKYGRYNYKQGDIAYSRLTAAALRHILAFNEGENCAQDSGVHHLGHAIANCMMLLELMDKKQGIDNRLEEK